MPKKLLDRAPEIVRGIFEYQQMYAAQDSELEKLAVGTRTLLEDQFITLAGEQGISRRERMLGIKPKAGSTPDERRFVLLARYSEQLPFTRRVLKQQLQNLCGPDGYSFAVDAVNEKVNILVALTAKANFDEVAALLERVLPCNMEIVLGLKYNQHETLARYTHSQLTTRTHNELRNEVMA